MIFKCALDNFRMYINIMKRIYKSCIWLADLLITCTIMTLDMIIYPGYCDFHYLYSELKPWRRWTVVDPT